MGEVQDTRIYRNPLGDIQQWQVEWKQRQVLKLRTYTSPESGLAAWALSPESGLVDPLS